MTTTSDEPITQEPPGAPTIDVPVEPSPAPAAAPAAAQAAAQAAAPAPKARRPIVPRPAPASHRAPASQARHTRVTVRRFGIFSVFRFALIFSVCAMLTIWLALLMIYLVLQAGGMIDSFAQLMGEALGSAEGTKGYTPIQIDGTAIFTYLFFAGCVMSVAWALIATFAAVVYNLIADMVGGVEVTLADRSRR